MVLCVSSIVVQFREKQKERKSKVTTRASDAERELDVKIENFFFAMDNYFTVPTVMKHLRDNGIGVMGTAMVRRGGHLLSYRRTNKRTVTSMSSDTLP
eukprot:11520441-Ditylum_brightwellii.AAC.1